MSSGGQIVGGVLGAIGGFFLSGGNPMGALKGAVYGASLGGMIDPPPGPDLKGPTLEDAGFNSSAYGTSLATLYGTIAHTGSIIYLENNEYKAVAKKQKTGGKGGGSKGSYTTTTYFATFAVAIGEAMPGSVVRRIWAGGKLIYSVGESVDADTLRESNSRATGWHYYDGSQTEPDSRMEAVLGVGNCPSYEGTAYIIFYDFDLTEYGNGLQGCPIKVEVISGFEEENDGGSFQKIVESITSYPANRYDEYWEEWRPNFVSVRGLSPGGAMYVVQWRPHSGGNATATVVQFNADTEEWLTAETGIYNTDIYRYPGLTFDDSKNWQEWDLTSGTLPNNYQDGAPAGWTFSGSMVTTFGGRLHVGSFNWDVEPSLGAAYYGGYYFIINNSHIIKLSTVGVITVSRATDNATGGTYYRLWYDEGFLYRAAKTTGDQLKVWVYDVETLDTIRTFTFGNFPYSDDESMLQFAVYGGIIVVGWATRYGASGGEIHYEQWRFKDFLNVQPAKLDTLVGKMLQRAGVGSGFRDLTALASDTVDGYRITDASSVRGGLGPLQTAYLFDLIDVGYKIKAVKRGGASVVTIPFSELGARGAGEALSTIVKRDRESDTQLPSRYTVTYIDYNREYDTNSQYADFPSRASNERNVSLPIVLSPNKAAQLADIFINLAWAERFSYVFTVPQKYLYLLPANVITVEAAAGVFVALRINTIGTTIDQRVEISARRAEPAVYSSGAVGIPVLPPSENIPVTVTPTTVLLDLPAITTETSGPGFGVVMSGSANWKGGDLLRSVDSGQTFDAIQAFTGAGTFGRAANYLSAGDYFVIDRAAVLAVNMMAGDFFAITEDQMLTGKNYCAYGVPGRWEIIQYSGVVVNSTSSVNLSGFVRGLFGSEWAGALHAANDYVVLLDDSDNAFIGADVSAIGATRKFKGVSYGQDAQLIDAVDFIYRGINLKPLSPVNIAGYIDSEVWYFSWMPRTRLPGAQWATGIGAPMGETALLFDIEVYEGSVLKKTYQSTVASFVYSSANQMADFDYLPTTLTVKIYQISSVVGRGYVGEKTIVGVADPYGDKVVLLLHFNGENNSPVFIDSSKFSRAVTAHGDAKIQVSGAKVGGACGVFGGAGDYLTLADSEDWYFADKDYTMGTWAFPTAFPALGEEILAHRTTADTLNFFFIRVNSSGQVRLYAKRGGSVVTDILSVAALTLNVWSHIRITRLNGVCKIWINGANNDVVTTNAAGLWPNVNAPLLIAVGDETGSYFNGRLDDLEITKGVARNSTSFTPPSTQLPDPL